MTELVLTPEDQRGMVERALEGIVPTWQLLPLTLEHSHRLEEIHQYWGLPVWAPREKLGQEPPPPTVLQAMADELGHALHGAGPQLAAIFATRLNESYPQRDASGVEYAARLAAELGRCPPDLLAQVVEDLLLSGPNRRAISEVRAEVVRHTTHRARLLAKVPAAERYWDWRRAEAEKAQDALAAAVLAAEAKAAARRLAPPTVPRPSAPLETAARGMSDPEPRYSRTDRRNHARLRALRTPAKSQ